MENFLDVIYNWFEKNQRDLPWRMTTDPYLIWISEIILQQTRVNQGLPYYKRFVQIFPDIRSVADATDDQLMKAWEGLGYYSRARHLQAAARTMAKQYGGSFPDRYEAIRSLKGIGDYTAAAVASIAFGMPYPVVDGNVFRFLSRYLGITEPRESREGKKRINEAADQLLDKNRPGYHNQAMMEFGALQCRPKNPLCLNCPVQPGCFAFRQEMTGMLPSISGKISRKTRFFYYCIPESEHDIVLEKRTGTDIWKNLYQFPLYESDHELEDSEILSIPLLKELTGDNPGITVEISQVYVQELTHRLIKARFIRISHPRPGIPLSGGIRIGKAKIGEYPFPAIIRNFVREKFIPHGGDI